MIITPGRDEKIFPGDILSVIGTDEQLGKLRMLLEETTVSDEEQKAVHIRLKTFTISESSPLRNKTIRQSNIRETVKALIVGVERNGERVLNPESTFKFESGDTVWIVGDSEQIDAFLKS